MEDSIIFFKAEYLVEVKEWLEAMGVNPHDALSKFPKLRIDGIEILLLSDPDHQVMFRLAFGHAISKKSIKITTI